MKRSLGMILFMLCLIFGMVPMTATADMTASYLDETGSSQSKEVKALPTNTTVWGTSGSETWYVVNESVTIGERVTVKGQVHLILADGANLTVNGGIGVPDSQTLTIYAQSTKESTMGTLTVENVAKYCAGIGGNDKGMESATITINGGSIHVSGGENGAGIGSGECG